MSRYLIDRIAALPNVDLHVGKELVVLEGDQTEGLTAAVFRNRSTGATHVARCAICSCSSAPIPTLAGRSTARRWTTKASSLPGLPGRHQLAPPCRAAFGDQRAWRLRDR